jgi:multidrug efflux pump subunit AcrB
MSDAALATPGRRIGAGVPGLSINGFTNSPNSGIVFAAEAVRAAARSEPVGQRDRGQPARQKYGKIQDAYIAVFPPPPVQGLGTIGGFRMQIEDRGASARRALQARPRT